tara:strand:- start:1237 stop:2379 length:1143 start_codon:yes stop_codon:yes gene_type:complete
MATTTTQILPPGYVDTLGVDFSNYTTGVKDIKDNPYYVDPASFTGANYVAGQDKFTTDAQKLAGGLGGYQDYLDSANKISGAAEDLIIDPTTGLPRPGPGTAALNQAGQDFNSASAAAAAGQGAGDQYLQAAQGYTGPNAYEQFMSPYQQQVIDATMASYNQQQGEKQAMLGASAGNAFGGGRFGVAEGQMMADSAIGGAGIMGNLLSQGFTQSNQLANQAYNQQMGMGTQAMNQASQNVNMYGQAGSNQMGLAGAQQGALNNQLSNLGTAAQNQLNAGQYDMSMLGNQINAYSTMGTQNQAYQQAILDAEQQAAMGTAYAGQNTLGFLGQQLATAQGAPSQTQIQSKPGPSTAQTLLGGGIGILGLLGYGNNNSNSSNS